MAVLIIALGSGLLYLIAYHTYGKWLGSKLFKLSASAITPAVKREDGNDFVPTSKGVVFGHHFTSIAGTGPIVGPALAVIWGWVPAVLWVLFGSIFIGAVHDLGTLVVSLRNQGQTVGDIAGRVLSPRARSLFLFILFLAVSIVLAIFGLVIAAVFKLYPSAIIPCLLQIPLAVMIGTFLHKKKRSLFFPSLLTLGVMYLTVAYGDFGVLSKVNLILANLPTIVWVVLLLAYSYVASILPVWVLLQPRDYMNALQLLTTLGLVILGMVVAGIFGLELGEGGGRRALEIVAPAFNLSPEGAPPIFPFLFITIACGAVSGFHCLVSSGTTSKQLKCETDARAIGYGSMLTEGFLAIIVILACVGGLGLGVEAEGKTLLGVEAYEARYGSWGAAQGLGAKVGAFVDGASNFLRALKIPAEFAVAIMGVFVASFAATTLDTACRLQRYVTIEIANQWNLKLLKSKHGATLFAVLLAGVIATPPAPSAGWELEQLGKGGLLLWPLFGATNQLLGGLAFLVVIFWLRQKKASTWFMIPSAVLMLVLPGYAMWLQLFSGTSAWLTGSSPNYLLSGFGLITILLEVWIIKEAVVAWRSPQPSSSDSLKAEVL